MLLDGSDNSTVGPVLGYVGSIQTIASRRIGGFQAMPPYELRTRFLFNPELNSQWFVSCRTSIRSCSDTRKDITLWRRNDIQVSTALRAG